MDTTIKNKIGEQTLLIFCFDSVSISEAFRNILQQEITEEVMASLRDLGEVLQGIQSRLISDGYIMINGEYYKKDKNI